MNVTPVPKRGPSASERLREIMRQSGMSGHEIAARSGVAHTIVNRFLNGSRTISFETFDRIAPVLKIRLVANTKPTR